MNLTDAKLAIEGDLGNAFDPDQEDGLEFLLTPFSFPTGEVIALAIEEDPLRVTDVGSVDGFLAERGISWDGELLIISKDLCRPRGVRIEGGLLVRNCTEQTLSTAALQVVQAALEIVGASRGLRPRMSTLRDPEN